MGIDKKTCRRCLEELGIADFHKSADKPDGLQLYCKKCKSSAAKKSSTPAAKLERAARRKARPDLARQALGMYNGGMTGAQISAVLGFSESHCIRLVEEAGGVIRDNETSHRRYSFDADFFSCVDSEEKAYWLGMLSADGCVVGRKVTLGLASKDEVHLEKFRHSLKSNHKIYNTVVDGHPQSQLVVTSQKLVSDLAKCGVGPRKSLTLVPWVGPAHLMKHYWRGVFDGDGCITFRTDTGHRGGEVSLIGSRACVDSFSRWVEEKSGILSGLREYASGITTVYYGMFRPAQAVCHLLYDDCSLYLDRKFKKAQDLFAVQGRQIGVARHERT